IAQLYARVTNFADGALTSATKSTQNRITDISKQVDAQQTRVDNYKERLVKQYSAMEKSMQKVKGQSSSFMSQIGR
ncbi:MAG: Flagellar hook-associated protein 2 C-terminus, partial [Fibrobacterota bacterium]